MNKWKIIVEFANLPLQKQIVIILAVFILSNAGITLFFLDRETRKETVSKADIKKLYEKIEQVQDDKAEFMQYHMDYVDQKENEYQKILVELDKINKK